MENAGFKNISGGWNLNNNVKWHGVELKSPTLHNLIFYGITKLSWQMYGNCGLILELPLCIVRKSGLSMKNRNMNCIQFVIFKYASFYALLCAWKSRDGLR